MMGRNGIRFLVVNSSSGTKKYSGYQLVVMVVILERDQKTGGVIGSGDEIGKGPLRLKVCLKSEMGHVYKLGRDVEKLVDVVYKLGSSFGGVYWDWGMPLAAVVGQKPSHVLLKFGPSFGSK
ncbi:hypothetical protein Tco_0497101 [Tanacetum coccineum]